MRTLISLLLLGGFVATLIGCEAEGKVDDDGAKVKIDTD